MAPAAAVTNGLQVPDVTARTVWDAVPAPERRSVLAAAADELSCPAPQLLASAWTRSFRDGVRTEWEDRARQLRERVALLALAAVLTGEVAPAHADTDACPHLDAAADGLVLLAEASTWCWAPHEGGTAARGEVVPDPDRPHLDLGAAEVASLFAWADHALGPHLDLRVPGLRRRLRREVDQRVLTPFEQRRDWHWIHGSGGRADNWNPWIHGAVAVAVLLLTDSETRRDRLVRLVAAGLEPYLASLPADGGIDEGVGYWWQGACRLLECLDLLAATPDPPTHLLRSPVLAAVLDFPHRMHLGGDHYVNAGDAPARLPAAELPWQVPFRWGLRLGRPEAAAHAAARARASGRLTAPAAGLGRALAALADPAWHAAVAGDEPGRRTVNSWLSRDTWLPDTQVLVTRESSGTCDGLGAAMKAGHNGEHHNHLDVGTYWVTLDGHPAVVDIGQPTYTAASFGPHRYDAWPLRSAWHNVPEPGAEQVPGAAHGAAEVSVDLGPDTTAMRAELSCAYPGGLLAGWHRTLRLVRTAEPSVEVEDRWTGRPGQVLLRHVLTGEVRCGSGRARIALAPDRVLAMDWDPALATATLDRRPLDDPLLRTVWGTRLTRLTLHLAPQAVAEGGITVRFRRHRDRRR